MATTRRAFFRLVARAAGAVAVSPYLPAVFTGPAERLSMYLSIDMITRESLAVLSRELQFTKPRQFAINGAKIGDRITVRKPPSQVVQ